MMVQSGLTVKDHSRKVVSLLIGLKTAYSRGHHDISSLGVLDKANDHDLSNGLVFQHDS